ncbi:unnamed protein product [Protopolystoma xenopodis]|uniref:Uncharacterized protein n=1 Tax=Protopolystoma xenopodis TaxID=117903 RepID=A0A3S5CJK0_9PLAT|nr:unnamed protein product [Protopolystoma xenopodis]
MEITSETVSAGQEESAVVFWWNRPSNLEMELTSGTAVARAVRMPTYCNRSASTFPKLYRLSAHLVVASVTGLRQMSHRIHFRTLQSVASSEPGHSSPAIDSLFWSSSSSFLLP